MTQPKKRRRTGSAVYRQQLGRERRCALQCLCSCPQRCVLSQ